MRPVLYVLTFLAVMGLAFWAYRENYATQQALKDVSALNREIATLRESLSVQRAEWAYLNRPDRLRELAALNFDRLGLLPLEAVQFGSAAQVSYPPDPLQVVTPQDLRPGDISGEVGEPL
ncbi:cell division protein FtsL [Rhodobacter sphaeroides]|jgi:Predicted secreted (periplasmic) protein|uniref:FtsL n=1 Tax=Cereibacter sphaeroides (strain ATCC 17023 / DSM 158 / JCM 6121 / CCUG 31486 / LMG 2827 / NBRC 12203 / NCIMB 8253 / ATH 2.4.1.) TaxID=272943 RepID=Q3J4N2_CERS4|nr:cell division protein FtsL [Cereibacter sphaeroides]ABN75884.1 putative FtsL [Cereibacter sphaeroides ATCC 17029]ABA78252.1 Putative FtsL [Cereibacter sphaeroides 2.4.1]ACM00267.1 FtsL [Cereibacter sphaeroides KD131]AMJ46611.1 cell division protein FtsL [Cereibacter sphaeroides]ANS33324.1 cell division protein FtsL [Cereibacter sphaeroides]